MSLAGLSARLDYSSNYRPPERRAPDSLPVAEPGPPPESAPDSAAPFDAAYYASRFKADLSRLAPPPATDADPEPTEAEDDPHLFNFFGNLSVLLLAVRAGDLPRAQSAADALEMDVLVERNAGRRPAESSLLDDLSRLFGAAHSHDEAVARAVAGRLAGEFRHAFNPPALAPPIPGPGAAAYETLAQYFDAADAAL